MATHHLHTEKSLESPAQLEGSGCPAQDLLLTDIIKQPEPFFLNETEEVSCLSCSLEQALKNFQSQM